MPLVRDGDDLRLTSVDVEAAVPFRRHLVLPGVVLTAAEVGLVLYPLWVLFDLGDVPLSTLLRIGVPVAIGAMLVWLVALFAWLLPIRACVVARRRAVRADRRLLARGYRATLRTPLRAFLARTALWVGGAFAVGSFLARYQGWRAEQALSLAALAGLHAAPIAGARALWLARILDGVRTRLFVGEGVLRGGPVDHRRSLTLWSLVVASSALIAHAAFLYFLMPITHSEYLAIETYLPPAAAIGWCGWSAVAYWLCRPLARYLQRDAGETHDASSATQVYRRSQALPYRLALVGIATWIVIAVVTGFIVRWWVGLELDDTVIDCLALLVVALAAAIYETLGHRDALRPVLAELSARYRIPVREVAPSLGLRAKLMVSFGGVVVLACGMALLWGFVQYKKLASDAAERQANIGLAWVRSEVQAAVAASPDPPSPALVEASVRELAPRNPEASAVVYYLDDAGGAPNSEVVAVGGGPMGAPSLTWYQAAEIRRGSHLSIGPAELAGNAGRLDVTWHGRHYDLGSVAVLNPDYRGRGQSLARPLRELLLFFIVLFGACAGIVVATVAQFVGPIRRLEQRADQMARGELTEPVTSGGDGDEIGRLTFALEDMRRALREKLRSTEEVNLDLERAVQRRTADLAKKNKELAETLDKLTRTQAQLVRSEKMASIGQLVAGIAHEINNPVNAIVNTVGPLQEAIGELDAADARARSEAAHEIRDMVRVVQRGAQRTKAIVGALHNYSRTDDEKVVDFDLNRSLDDSLELLRHLLRGNITVERRYGEVGRIRGHAGQLGQVFMNLLTNAIQALAGREAPVITIETRLDGGHVVVVIGDNGPGIPPDVVPRIFDPFFTTKDVGEGTGLGLAIVHELVERHEGRIDVDTHVGTGTRFIVTLPRQYEPVRRERVVSRSDRIVQQTKPPG
ncbi:MAG TPA: ATP-binding protein [Kofleriaceae bacterium]|nr:ATP-binding protein [Kofleriaceae bacterium]